MSEIKRCKNCQTEMEQGYIPDGSHRGSVKSVWLKGEAIVEEYKGKKSDILHIPNKNEGKDIITFRCPQCGLLEFYAF
jgi:predicted nucleic-acid-binding Zn-ribbon protein